MKGTNDCYLIHSVAIPYLYCTREVPFGQEHVSVVWVFLTELYFNRRIERYVFTRTVGQIIYR